jgi:hypothetical protein
VSKLVTFKMLEGFLTAMAYGKATQHEGNQ